jgi:hypothetical protein
MSAQKRPLLTLTILASAVLTKYQAVTYAGAVAGNGVAVAGFATEDAAIGDYVATDALGTTIAIAGADVAAGAKVAVGSSGKVITAVSTKIPVGIALQAGVADQPFEILLIPGLVALA